MGRYHYNFVQKGISYGKPCTLLLLYCYSGHRFSSAEGRVCKGGMNRRMPSGPGLNHLQPWEQTGYDGWGRDARGSTDEGILHQLFPKKSPLLKDT